MKDYDISENLLKDAINYPDSVTEGYGDRKIYQKKLDSYLLRVIVKANKGIIRVVTVPYIGPGVRDMKYAYDPETDILLIKLSKAKPDFGEQKENIITHYSRQGKPIEIEILDASKTAVKIVETIVQSKRALITTQH